MIQPILIRPEELRGIVSMKEAIDAVRLGFQQWGENPQINAPRRRIHIPTGVRVSVHQGGVPGAGATGMMTHCEWVKPSSERQEYPRLNHPVIVLYDAAEGELKAIIIGEITCSELPDNIAVTGLRTAATSAVGTDLLARSDAERVGLLGSAGQARNHLAALCAVRRIKQVKVFSPTAANRERFAEMMAPLVKADIVPVATAAEAIRGADIVLTTTNSSVPVFDGNLLEAGAHVTTIVGSNVGLVQGGFTRAKRREIDDATLKKSQVLAIASIQQAIQDEQGDIFDPVQRGVIRLDQLVEIGEILAREKSRKDRAGADHLFQEQRGPGSRRRCAGHARSEKGAR